MQRQSAARAVGEVSRLQEAHVGLRRGGEGHRAETARRAAGGRALGLAAGRAHADRAGRHPRVLRQRRVQGEEVAGRLLAEDAAPRSAAAWTKSLAGIRRDRRRSSSSRRTRRSISSRRSRTAPARPICARSCSSRTTTRITSASSSRSGAGWGHGRSADRQISRPGSFVNGSRAAPDRRRLRDAGRRRRVVRRGAGAGLCRRAVGRRTAHDKRDRADRRTGHRRPDHRAHLAAARHAAFRRARRRAMDADPSCAARIARARRVQAVRARRRGVRAQPEGPREGARRRHAADAAGHLPAARAARIATEAAADSTFCFASRTTA